MSSTAPPFASAGRPSHGKAESPFAYRLPTLPYVRLRFRLSSVGEADLPPYKGSLLRGAFGHALRRMVCARGPRQACEDCLLRRGCTYTRLFETFVEGEPPPFLGGLRTAPRPYVFEPGDEVRHYRPGDPLPFDLLLVGQAAELQAFALAAVEAMVTRGLGRRRHPFRLESVRHLAADGSWPLLYRPGDEAASRFASPLLPATDNLGSGPVELAFLTPTRLLARGRRLEELSFRALAFRMLRRHLELAHFYGAPGEVDWSFQALLAAADRVRIVVSDLRWHDWARYSNRQKQSMVLGGFVGRLRLEGDLAPFHPLLRAAEVFHVGKGATFGLGRLAVAPGGGLRPAS